MGPNGGSLLVCFKKINKINVLKKYIWVMTSRAAIKRLKASHDNEKQVRLPF